MITIGTTVSRQHGQKVVIYGTEGIGKTSLAANFPDPVFIDTEGSTKNYEVKRIEEGRPPSSWTELMNWIGYVKQNPNVCKTLVIDTIDWSERLCNAHVCAQHGVKGIEDFGYGNGYTYASEELGRLLDRLSDLTELGIHVVLTAHAKIRTFTQPDEMGSFDRYELKLGSKTSNKTSALVKEWADLVLFINYKTVIVTDDKTKKGKAQGGERIMYTTHRPAWDAKNRHGLPDELPLDYSQIAHIFESKQATQAAAPQREAPQQVSTGIPDLSNEEAEIIETPAEPSNASEDYQGWPQALVDLMKANKVSKREIKQACGPVNLGGKGYFPESMAVEDYPIDFINAVLIAAWPQVLALINENRKDPF